MSQEHKIIIGIGGSSGAIYAKRLLLKLANIPQPPTVGIVMSENAIVNWELEIGPFDKTEWPFTFYKKHDFFAPFASGSARYTTMIVCHCSMGLLSRIAHGISDDLSY
jgi:flavin prenyltransferase